MAELKSVVFDLSQDRLAYWGNVTGITFNNSELRKAWIRAQGYIRSQVVDPLMRDQSWQSYKWQGWIIEAKKPSGIEWRLGELSDIKLPTQRSCVYVPTDVCSITASRETWRTHFDQAHLKYVLGSDLLATDVPPFANYFYLLQCFIPGIFTIPAWSQEGSIALPSSRWVEANKGALRRIFGEIKLRALQNAVAQRRGDFVPSKSEPAPLPQVASALSYQVIFDLNNPALDRWKTDTQLGWDDSQMSQAWKRAKQTFIPNSILQPLRTQWTDLTGNNRGDIMAKFQYVAQPSRELYVPSCTQFPRRARMRWKQRFESAGIQPSNTPSLELNNSIPPLANFFYLLQCFIPGIFVIASPDGRKAFLPPAKWVAGQRAALVQIFGQPRYQQLKDATTNMRIFSAPAPNPASAPPIPTQKAKKPKKQKTQRSSGGSWSSPTSFSMGK